MSPWTITYGLATLLLGAWLGHKLTEKRKRDKAAKESLRKDTERKESARGADAQLRRAIATAVNSTRSQLKPLLHSISPDRPATQEQVERIERAATDLRRLDERIHELQNEGLRRQVHAWYQNLTRAADDLEHLSRPVSDFARIANEHLRKSKRGYALARQRAAQRQLQSILDDGAPLELIGSV